MSSLKKFNGTSWDDSKLRKLGTATDTLTTLPADIYPTGTTATVGLKGNTVQSGTPTPQNPVMPQGCGERTGNLWDGTLLSGFYKAASFTLDTSGGTVYKSIKIHLVAGAYTVSFKNTVNIVRQILDGVYSENIGSNINSYTFTATTDAYFGISFRLSQSSSTPWDNSNIMLNTGSTALPYEPYGYKLTISSANTTTPVYLGEVETTRRVKKLVLTGEENWTKNDTGNPSNYLYYQTGYSANKTCVCSHLADMGTLSTSKVGIFNGNNVLYLNFGSAIMNTQQSGNTVAGLKEYLAAQYANGTPVTVWYVLSSATTGTVNEPIRKIGDYADTVSGITIPTITGKDTVDVETTLKPSEVSLAYTGWHDASVKEWDGSQWV